MEDDAPACRAPALGIFSDVMPQPRYAASALQRYGVAALGSERGISAEELGDLFGM